MRLWLAAVFRALRPEIYREMVAHVDDATKSNLQIAKSLAVRPHLASSIDREDCNLGLGSLTSTPFTAIQSKNALRIVYHHVLYACFIAST